MWYGTQNKHFGWVPTSVNEVHKPVVFILDDIYIFLLPIFIRYNATNENLPVLRHMYYMVHTVFIGLYASVRTFSQ